jgi:glycosyltransferase involved in cell wall biosynthesis
MPIKLGVLTTHPIQYQVPWFRLLAAHPNIDLQVFFGMIPNATQQGDGFGVKFEWDIPLLEGYPYRVLNNVARNPAVTSFSGCDTPEIFNIVRQESWDAFIVNGWVAKSCLQLLAACRLHRVPCLVRGESNSLRPRALWKQGLQRMLVSQYSAFLSIGQGNREFYRHHGIADQAISHTPYCIDNTRFATAAAQLQPERDQIQAQFGLQPQKPTFLFCGKFIPKKHPLDLLQAMAHLQQTQPLCFQLLMVGDGELRPACEQFAREANLPVQFSGFLNQQDIVKAYIAADCLVLPSDDGETWGLVVNEAMACGLPAIVSDQVGCHLDLIQPGVTGATYPMGSIEALAQILQAMAESGLDSMKTLGHNAQQRVINHYNYDIVLEGILQALGRVIHAG